MADINKVTVDKKVIEGLQADLVKAIHVGDFEKAARLRESIKNAKGE